MQGVRALSKSEHSLHPVSPLQQYEADLSVEDGLTREVAVKSFLHGAVFPGVTFGCLERAEVAFSGVLQFLGSDEPPLRNLGCAVPTTLGNGWVAYLNKSTDGTGKVRRLTFNHENA